MGSGKAPGPDELENEVIKMLPYEMRDTLHQFMTVMWATRCTPTTWKTSDTCLLYKDKGSPTDLASYRPIGLANTIYKLWTALVTKALSEYAESRGMLSSSQAGFRRHKSTAQQLQALVMVMEDAKLNNRDLYALLVDFTCAFNTTDQDKLLWLMYDMGFPTDAIDVVRDLYTGALTSFKLPEGRTGPVAVDRGTIQGDSLSPFLFLLYIEPLLRWLHVGGRGYEVKSCGAKDGQPIVLSSVAFADDITPVTGRLSDLRVQAEKISLFSDWGCLKVSQSKTLVSAALHGSERNYGGAKAAKQLRELCIQGKPVTYLADDQPFTYLGVKMTLTLNRRHQHAHMLVSPRAYVAIMVGTYLQNLVL